MEGKRFYANINVCGGGGVLHDTCCRMLDENYKKAIKTVTEIPMSRFLLIFILAINSYFVTVTRCKHSTTTCIVYSMFLWTSSLNFICEFILKNCRLLQTGNNDFLNFQSRSSQSTRIRRKLYQRFLHIFYDSRVI